MSSSFSILLSSTSGKSKNFSIRSNDNNVSTKIFKVLGKFINKLLKLVKIPKLEKISSILNSSFKY